jgi:hypothetical protein
LGKVLLPIVLSSLSPLVFLSGGNASLWLLILALVAVVSVLPKDSLQWIAGLFDKTRTTP